MTIYIQIVNTEHAVGAPVTSSWGGKVSNNVLAIQEGDATASGVRIQEAALSAGVQGKLVTGGDAHTQPSTSITGLGTLATLNQVAQAQVAAFAIGQTQLKTVTGRMSDSTTPGAYIILPGGGYGYTPETSNGNANQAEYGAWDIGASPTGNTVMVTIGTTPLQRIHIRSGDPGVSQVNIDQRYVQGSPPYNHGDGEIGLFVFAIINNSTNIVETCAVAPEASWHNNGKTNCAAGYLRNGIPYRMEKKGNILLLNGEISESEVLSSRKERDRFIMLNEETEELEITQEMKMRDMNDIPHPFIGNDLTGKTVVMLDPAHDETWKLAELHDAGFNINKCLFDKSIKISNSPLKRLSPNGVQCCSFKWK